MSAVLELEGFGVAFGDRTVLRDVSACVAPAGCTVVLGPSGTGKSTLLRTLAGCNRATPQLRTWGRATYAGAPCGAPKHPALVMQNCRLLVANVLENLVCMLPGRAGLTRAMQIAALRPLLAACGQEHVLDLLARQVVELPLGLQRIVAILREVVAGPALLMLDEPTSGLPAPEAQEVLRAVQAVARDRAVLLVLHHIGQAEAVADDVLLLAGGRVQEMQPGPAFFVQPRSAAGRQFLATGSCAEPAATAPAPLESEPLPAQAPPAAAPGTAAAPSAWGPRGFTWLLPGRLAGTPWPGIVHGAAYDLRALRAVGITHLVSLTEEPFDALVAAGHGIACLASPMPDMQPPTLQQALALCTRIDRLLAAGAVVAVHCHAGLGRTGTVLAAYWLWLGRGGLSAVRALEDVRRLEPGWVQSESQVSFLQEFARALADTRDARHDFNDPLDALDVALAGPDSNV